MFQERRRRKWRIVENAVPKYCIQIEVTLFLRNKQESITLTENYKYWKCIDFIITSKKFIFFKMTSNKKKKKLQNMMMMITL